MKEKIASRHQVINKRSFFVRFVSVLMIILLTAVSSTAGVGFAYPSNRHREMVSESKQSMFDLGWIDQMVAQSWQPENQEQSKTYSLYEGYKSGRYEAKDVSVSGSFVGGICGALFLGGFIGTALIWAMTDGNQPRMSTIYFQEHKGSDFMMGFNDGYHERSKEKKRDAVLWGGTAGTVILTLAWVAIFLDAE